MHPAGIEFGLANNLLQLQGDAIVLSDKLMAHISTAARRQLHGKRIDGTELLDTVIDRGLAKMKFDPAKAKRSGYRSFYAKLQVIVFETIFPYAERAGIGYRVGRTFYFTQKFGAELMKRKKILRPAGETYGYEKMLFMACYDAVLARCKAVIPEDARHADLIALCMWEVWDQIMLNSLFERFGTP